MPTSEYLETIVRGLVNHPDEVVVEMKTDEAGVLLTLTVHPEDVGIVMGKLAQNLNAIRTLIRCKGRLNHQAVAIKTNFPPNPNRPVEVA